VLQLIDRFILRFSRHLVLSSPTPLPMPHSVLQRLPM
jgi:hypothetical protein